MVLLYALAKQYKKDVIVLLCSVIEWKEDRGMICGRSVFHSCVWLGAWLIKMTGRKVLRLAWKLFVLLIINK